MSEKRDMGAAKSFFKKALATAAEAPEKVTTDGHDAYPLAIRETLGTEVEHRNSRYMNNVIEQDHQGIKGRYKGMRGFKDFIAAEHFCEAFDALKDYLQPHSCS